MRTGLTLSMLMHAGLLLWAVISIGGAKPLETVSVPMQVDLLTVAEFNDIRKGNERSTVKEPKPDAAAAANASPAEKPKKVATLEPVRAPEPSKPEPPKPEPPTPEPPKPEPPKPEPPKAEPPQPKPDPIAEALNKLPPEDEAPRPEPEKPKPVPNKAEPKPEPKPVPAKPAEKAAEKPKAKSKPKATLAQLQKALLDKQPNAGAKTQSDAGGSNSKLFEDAFGAEQASGTKLSATESAMLASQFRRQVSNCWTLANGGLNAEQLAVRMRVDLNPDGTVVGTPRVMSSSNAPGFALAAENAVRAVLECQPYKLAPDLFEHWSQIDATFDPQKMFAP